MNVADTPKLKYQKKPFLSNTNRPKNEEPFSFTMVRFLMQTYVRP